MRALAATGRNRIGPGSPNRLLFEGAVGSEPAGRTGASVGSLPGGVRYAIVTVSDMKRAVSFYRSGGHRMSTAPLRCLVAEDEPEAQANLVSYLRRDSAVEVVGMVADGLEAVSRIDELAPDLVLLDVQLPELDGISVLRRIRSRPEVIFTTAYESYAVGAFELGAVDYLVKPFGAERLLAALARVRGRRPLGPETPSSVDRALATATAPLTRFFARKGQRLFPVEVADIVRIEASGEYARVHTPEDSFLVNVSLRDLLRQLDPQRFARIHRSHIVNLAAVDHLRPADDRRLLVVLRGGASIVASRGGSERLRRLVR